MRLQCRLTTSCTYVNSLSVNHCIVHVQDSLLQCSDRWKLCQTNVDCLRAFHFKHDYLLFLVFVFYFTLLQRNKKRKKCFNKSFSYLPGSRPKWYGIHYSFTTRARVRLVQRLAQATNPSCHEAPGGNITQLQQSQHEHRLDQQQTGNFNAGSRVQSFQRAFVFSFGVELFLLIQPVIAWSQAKPTTPRMGR